MTQPAQPGPIVCPDCHQTRPPLNLIHQCHGCVGCAVHAEDVEVKAAQPNPAAELRAAAARLRGGDWRIDQTITEPIAAWLDDSADGDDHGEHNPYALAVARALLGCES